MANSKKIQEVWEKGRIIQGKNPNVYRSDSCGNILYHNSYGLNSPMGWEIDHKMPKSKGGSNELSNLQPLQTQTNRSKSDKYPFKCKK